MNRSTFIYAAFCSLAVFIFSLFWTGGDWYISESQGAIIQNALSVHYQFPYFSFLWNQGSYLIQDLQNPLFSIFTPINLFFGSTLSLRLVILLLSFSGFIFFYFWIRRWVGETAALLGGSAWTMNTWVFWRVSWGNDFFMYGLLLPLFLKLIEMVIDAKTGTSRLKGTIFLGVSAGLFVLAPAFHAMIYLIFPVTVMYGFFYSIWKKIWKTDKIALTVTSFLCSALIALIISLPKLMAFLKLRPERALSGDGSIPLLTAVEALFWPFLQTALSAKWGSYGPHEAHVAPLLGTLFSLPLYWFLYRRSARPWKEMKIEKFMLFFGIFLVSSVFVYIGNEILWNLFRKLMHGAVRVPARFMWVASFGLILIFVSLWSWRIDDSLQKRRKLLISIVIFANILTLAFLTIRMRKQGYDFHGAKYQPKIVEFSTTHNAMGTLAVANLDSDAGNTWLAWNRDNILQGVVMAGQVHIIGSPCPNEVLVDSHCPQYTQYIYKKFGPPGSYGRVCSGSCDQVEITHNEIRLHAKDPDGTAILELKYPALGFENGPPEGVKLTSIGLYQMKLSWHLKKKSANSRQDHQTVAVFKVKNPVSNSVFALAAISLISCCALLSWLYCIRPRIDPHAPLEL